MAYHSAKRTGVYHTCGNCTEGNNIEPENHRSGKPAGAKLCQTCKRLTTQGKCR